VIVEGAAFLGIHVFLQETYEAMEAAADEIAERLQALGGVPHTSMPALSDAATVEPENVYDVHTSLRNDFEMYGDIMERSRDHRTRGGPRRLRDGADAPRATRGHRGVRPRHRTRHARP